MLQEGRIAERKARAQLDCDSQGRQESSQYGRGSVGLSELGANASEDQGGADTVKSRLDNDGRSSPSPVGVWSLEGHNTASLCVYICTMAMYHVRQHHHITVTQTEEKRKNDGSERTGRVTSSHHVCDAVLLCFSHSPPPSPVFTHQSARTKRRHLLVDDHGRACCKVGELVINMFVSRVRRLELIDYTDCYAELVPLALT